MKIKIFCESDKGMLEQKVNEFVKDKSVIDIKYSTLLIPEEAIDGVVIRYAIHDRVLIEYSDISDEVTNVNLESYNIQLDYHQEIL